MDLTNKVAIVTGGGQGIGEGICEVFAKNGSTVIVTDINYDSAKNVEKKINSLNGKSISYVLDVTENEEFLEVELPSDGVVEDNDGAVVSSKNEFTLNALLAFNAVSVTVMVQFE